MPESKESPLFQTGLYTVHNTLMARMVPFAGWIMPLQYTSILAETRAVRTSLGLFDISHMGRIRINGTGAVSFLDLLFTGHVAAMQAGRVRYGFLLNRSGGIIDDVIIARLEKTATSPGEPFLMICNAANRETVLSWLHQWSSTFPHVKIEDTTLATTMIAAQGPESEAIMNKFWPNPITNLRFFYLTEVESVVGNAPILVSRTGYTGEDGFELIVDKEYGLSLWHQLQESGGVPCGLGARDLLRLEAGLSLHGTDIDSTTTPLEGGLERFVSLDTKDSFIGHDVLVQQKIAGVQRHLVGFTLLGRGIPRHDYKLLAGGEPAGVVTSGGYSPILDTGIGMGYVPSGYAKLGTMLEVDLRGRRVPARVVSLPFYRRSKIRGSASA